MAIFIGKIIRMSEPTMMIGMEGREFPCTLEMWNNVSKHFSRGDFVEIETNTQGQVKNMVLRAREETQNEQRTSAE